MKERVRLKGRTLYLDFIPLSVNTYGKYKTPGQLDEACNAYFKSREYVVLDKFGRPVTDFKTGKPQIATGNITVSGLCHFLYLTMEEFRQYSKIPSFSGVCEHALLHIRDCAERKALSDSKGAVFLLERYFGMVSEKEQVETEKTRSDAKISKRKLKMSQEEHAIKMDILRAGIDVDDDKDIHVTITRAVKD